MTAATLSLNESSLLTVLRSVIMSMLDPSVEVIKGQVNRVSEPASLNYVVITPMVRQRLGTNTVSYDIVNGVKMTREPVQFTFQCDVHGPAASDNAQIIATLIRDGYSFERFKSAGIAAHPLYADDPRQMTFTNGESQYEDRWSVDVQIQANVVVGTFQDFANVVVVSPVLANSLPS